MINDGEDFVFSGARAGPSILHPEPGRCVLPERFAHPYVCPQNLPRFMPSLLHHHALRTVPDGLAHMTRPETVTAQVLDTRRTRTARCPFHEVGDGILVKTSARDTTATIDRAEDRAVLAEAQVHRHLDCE